MAQYEISYINILHSFSLAFSQSGYLLREVVQPTLNRQYPVLTRITIHESVSYDRACRGPFEGCRSGGEGDEDRFVHEGRGVAAVELEES
jgi:hypothetical protein